MNFAQVGKFLLSGLVVNASAYVVYLLLTVFGVGHKTAMTLVFVAGMLLSYNMNRRWTFAFREAGTVTRWRFVAAYATAYGLNLSSMWLAVDLMGMPHYWVQAANLAVISALLFLAQKYWIFVARPIEKDGLGNCGAGG